jgi:hypothetical protein
MHLAGEASSADAYGVAVKAGASGKVLDAWGPSYVRDQSLGPDWSTQGPGIPDYVKTPIFDGPLAGGETAVSGADPLGADAIKLDLQAEALVIEKLFAVAGHGLVRFADGRQMSLEEAAGKPFCTKPGGCTCPEGSPGAGHTWIQTSTGPLKFGLAGHTDGIDVWISGQSVDTTCAEEPEDFVPAEPCYCPPGPLGGIDSRPPATALVALRRSAD